MMVMVAAFSENEDVVRSGAFMAAASVPTVPVPTMLLAATITMTATLVTTVASAFATTMSDLALATMVAMLLAAMLTLLDRGVVNPELFACLRNLHGDARQLLAFLLAQAFQDGIGSTVLGGHALLHHLFALVGERNLELVLRVGDGHIPIASSFLRHAAQHPFSMNGRLCSKAFEAASWSIAFRDSRCSDVLDTTRF